MRDQEGLAPCLPHGTLVGDGDPFRTSYFHRVTVTRVPFPGADSIENSLTRRLLPPRPRPIPLPVVNPSLSANSTSGMPGPWSSKCSLSPTRPPAPTCSMVIDPPLP